MKRIAFVLLGAIATSTSVFAQAQVAMDPALLAAPANLREGATIIKWKPDYGSVWYHLRGPDREHARPHTTIAVPGATTASTGFPDNPKQGGVWLMDAGTSTAHLMTPGQ